MIIKTMGYLNAVVFDGLYICDGPSYALRMGFGKAQYGGFVRRLLLAPVVPRLISSLPLASLAFSKSCKQHHFGRSVCP
ncbi:hypothetical protein SAY87_016404 [Trapa incisa]|uniref:Uncharacterized protein n=1 Tax=Trapa incisa TaxID=236973 RepID=A0AAN7L172_9MYRT|nr:hypothetical protein SAY87_016404 [Trapa incisa]